MGSRHSSGRPEAAQGPGGQQHLDKGAGRDARDEQAARAQDAAELGQRRLEPRTAHRNRFASTVAREPAAKVSRRASAHTTLGNVRRAPAHPSIALPWSPQDGGAGSLSAANDSATLSVAAAKPWSLSGFTSPGCGPGWVGMTSYLISDLQALGYEELAALFRDEVNSSNGGPRRSMALRAAVRGGATAASSERWS
jgi:hypothetical protein